MNVLQVISGEWVNGAIRHCYDLTCELALRGHRVLVLHKPGAWISRQPFPPGVDLMVSTIKRFPGEIRRIAEAIKPYNIDILHSHHSKGHLFTALLSAFYNYPRVATCHVTYVQLHWHFTDRIIAPSESTAGFLQNVMGFPRERIDVIYNFVHEERLQPSRSREDMRQELGLTEEDFLILTVGEVIPRKNQELLIAAMPEVAAAGVRPVAFFAGKVSEDYGPRLEKRIRKDKSAAFVRLAGERHDIANLLAAADCVCLPSRREVLPIALLEAMSAGLPAVATDVGGVAELVRDGMDGIIFKSGDQAGLASALIKLARDPGLRRRMGASGQERVRSRFVPEVAMKQVEECYREACLRRTRRARASVL